MNFPAAPVAASSERRLDQEHILSDRDFERVQSLIYELAGIVIEPQKRQMVHARLSRRLRATEISSFASYLDQVETKKNPALVQDFVNAITTNLTSFFREMHHFQHLREQVLRKMDRNGSRMRIWSAGCSSGEEPYSIALTVLASGAQLPSDLRILATDLDTNVLEKAKSGIYPAEKAGAALAPFANFVEKDAKANTIRIVQEARNLIAFRQLNLIQPWPMSGPFDVIFCRNVLIYFNADTKALIINRFAEMLHPGGFLYLGHSESILGEHPKLANEGQTTYRRRPI